MTGTAPKAKAKRQVNAVEQPNIKHKYTMHPDNSDPIPCIAKTADINEPRFPAEVDSDVTVAASQQGRAGLRLQHALPDARILYVSATGATTAISRAKGIKVFMDLPFMGLIMGLLYIVTP